MKDLHREILELIKAQSKVYVDCSCYENEVIFEQDFYDLATDILKLIKDRENGTGTNS